MYLDYLNDDASAEVLVLNNAQDWRIEMFVLANEDDTFSLIALAGKWRQRHDKIKLQGPFQQRREAQAARSAIARSLLADGFVAEKTPLPQWRLAAQSAIRGVREAHRNHRTDCHFDPGDVYFDD